MKEARLALSAAWISASTATSWWASQTEAQRDSTLSMIPSSSSTLFPASEGPCSRHDTVWMARSFPASSCPSNQLLQGKTTRKDKADPTHRLQPHAAPPAEPPHSRSLVGLQSAFITKGKKVAIEVLLLPQKGAGCMRLNPLLRPQGRTGSPHVVLAQVVEVFSLSIAFQVIVKFAQQNRGTHPAVLCHGQAAQGTTHCTSHLQDLLQA